MSTKANPLPLPKDKPVTSTFTQAIEIDWFGADLTAGQTYLITLRGAEVDGLAALADLRSGELRWLTAEGWQLASVWAQADGQLILSVTPEKSGYYLFQATTMGRTGGYSLTLAEAQTKDDFGASVNSHGTLALNGSVAATLEQPGDIDWFRVDGLKSDQGYTFASNNAGVQLSLINDAQYVVATGTAGQPLSYSAFTSGTYYVKATSPSGVTGGYSVQASGVADDYPADASTSGRLVPGAAVNGQLEVGGDSDWYLIDAPAGYGYKFTVTRADGQPASGRVVFREGFDANIGINSLYSPRAGETKYFTVGGAAGAYTINVEKVSDDHGNAASNSSSMAASGVTGTIAYGGDTDWFAFQANAGEVVQFNLAGSNGESAGTAGVQISYVTPDGQDRYGADYRAETSGTHYVVVSSSYSYIYQPVGYTLKMAATGVVDDIPSVVTAVQMVPGVAASGKIEAASDSDFFKASLQAGVTYTIRGGADLAQPGASLYTPQFQIQVTTPGYVTYPIAQLRNTDYSFTATATGEYRFEVMSFGGTGSYNLTLQAAADDVGATAATAGSMAVGTTLNATLAGVGMDVDWYAVSLTAGTKYNFDLSYWRALGQADMSFALLDSSGFTYANTVLSNGTLSGTYAPSSSGTYYLRIADANGNFGAYSVRLSTVAADDHGDSPVSATSVVLGAVASGQLGSATDVDYFKMTLEAGRYYTVAVNSIYQGSPVTERAPSITGPDGSPVYANGWWKAPASGDYHFKISDLLKQNASGYTLQVSPGLKDDHADGMTGATPLTLGSSVAALSEYGSDSDSFQFAVVAGKAYTVKLSTSAGMYGSVRVMDQQYGQVASESILTNGMPALNFTAKETGNYYLVVSPNGYSSAAYSVTVSAQGATAVPAVPKVGTAGADVFNEDGLFNSVDGGAGFDVLKLLRGPADYTVRKAGNGFELVKADTSAVISLAGIERLQFNGSTTAVALDSDGVGGQAYRMYQAAFNRTPDSAGLGYWIDMMDKGMSLQSVAKGFAGSAEFASIYGSNPTALQLVNKLYENVLHRPGEAAGIAYWTKVLEGGASVAAVLASFSESPENQAGVAAVIGNGFSYTIYG